MNKYVQLFHESVKKLEETEDYSWMDDEDELPPLEYTDDQKEAIQLFDNYLNQLNKGLIARKDFALIASKLFERLPKFDYLRSLDAKLPNKFN